MKHFGHFGKIGNGVGVDDTVSYQEIDQNRSRSQLVVWAEQETVDVLEKNKRPS